MTKLTKDCLEQSLYLLDYLENVAYKTKYKLERGMFKDIFLSSEDDSIRLSVSVEDIANLLEKNIQKTYALLDKVGVAYPSYQKWKIYTGLEDSTPL